MGGAAPGSADGAERARAEQPRAGLLRAGRLSSQVPSEGETFHELAILGSARVEHIVSSATPVPELQIQAWDEWVLLMSGVAELELSGERLRLTAGEWLILPAGTPHRVLATAAGTHWLAVHAPAQPADEG